jgi:hypothetical protein
MLRLEGNKSNIICITRTVMRQRCPEQFPRSDLSPVPLPNMPSRDGATDDLHDMSVALTSRLQGYIS